MPTRTVSFAKAHGLGNDFLLVESAGMEGLDPSQLARRICDRHSGVGGDGLVTLGTSRTADALFRIYNADGSEAGLSGNAMRCAGAWLASRSKGATESVKLETRVGLRELHFLERRGREWIFRTEIGRPSFAATDVPFRPPSRGPLAEPVVGFPLPVGDATLRVTVLSMGNPQCILLVEDWNMDWKAIGSEIESHPYFPDRTNVGFVRVAAENHIEARFWERGAGHTLASGTGSCACAVAAHLAGKTLRNVRVALERGEMEVNWRDDRMVELTGPAVIVAEGSYLWEEAS